MQILDRIQDQIAATKLPLVAITLSAVPCPDTPVILTLHWHGFIREKLVDDERAAAVAFTPVPSSALQLNDRWRRLGDLDEAALEAGWELGAWDVARAERPGCIRPGADTSEAIDCLKAFGQFPFGTREWSRSGWSAQSGAQVVVADAPDADDLLRVASRSGYLMWQFRPVHGGIWGEVAQDATLGPDGTREPPCPTFRIPPAACEGPRKTVIRFGEPADRSNPL